MAKEQDSFVPSIEDILNSDPDGVFDSLNPPADPPTDPAPKPGDKTDPPTDPKGEGDTSDDDSTGEPKVKVQKLFTSFVDETKLSDNQKETRQAFLEEYKGAAFDKDGNIVDKDGKVVKTFEEIYKDIAADEVKLDKDGNQIDAEGKIIKTKAEIDAEKSLVNKLNQNSNYPVKDENGNLKVYTDDEEGIVQYTDDVSIVKAQKYIEDYFNSHPVLSEVSKHLLAGGELKDFQTEVDYSKVKPEGLTEAQKLDYIRESFRIKNFSTERIEANITRIKDGNDIEAELKFALEDLGKHQEAGKQARQERYDAMIEKQKNDEIAYFNAVKSTVDKGELVGLKIPATEKEAFFNYLAQPVKDGKSKATIDREAEDIPTVLTLEYLRFKGYKFQDLFKAGAGTARVKSLRELLKRDAQVKNDAFGSNASGGSSVNPDDITLENLLGMNR